MNTILKIFSLTVTLLLVTPGIQAEERLRVIDNGTDGDVRFYSVICPNGKRSAVSDYYEEDKVCTMLVLRLENVCRIGWRVDEAAKEACSR